jgi:flagellar biosynthesis protein FlhF
MTQVHKYCAASIEEATALIRNSLGPDAMIISTDRLKGRDGKAFFEICAVPANQVETQQDAGGFDDIKRELACIKQMMASIGPHNLTMSRLLKIPGAVGIYSKLINQGVEEEIIEQILAQSGVCGNCGALSADDARKRVIMTLMRMMSVIDPFAPGDKKQIVAAFVGTTGVGKTTTIAKIAADLMVQCGKSVGLISIDTYRIGAMEQLKNYADILGIPCFQAFTRRDLLLALGRMRSRDVVLIDTAGRSQYDLSRLDGLKKMIGDHASIETHLLLSVGMRPSEMKATARSFCALNYKTYLFTKLDEVRQVGNILNQMATDNIPISYVTTGQNVPEDIDRADKKKLVSLLMGKTA